MLARTDSPGRAFALLLVVIVAATVIGGRLAWWHVFQSGRLSALAADQMAGSQTVPAERGEIRDANGVLLATSVELQSIYATPPSIADPVATAEVLARATGLDRAELEATLSSDRPWVWLQRRVPHEVSNAVRALELPGIGMLSETQRVYPVAGIAPDTTIAAQLLGYVNVDGVGQYGLEEAHEALLGGAPGWVSADEDVVGREIAASVSLVRPAVDGSDVRLTIDAGLQHILEDEIWRTFRTNRAQGATGVILDVHTGAVMAMVSYPSFDANRYSTTDTARFLNPAVSRQYEPGSVMKAFTIAAALESGAITTSDEFVDDNNLQLAGVRIQNADRYTFPWGHGPITARDVLNLSNNVGAARIGLQLGGRGLYDWFHRFGFGAPTGIDLAGEQPGVIWDLEGPNGSGDLTTAQNAFGQGLSVTAIQLAAAYGAIANGGTLMRPYVVAEWTDPAGVVHETEPTPVRRVVSEETAATMRELLTDAIDNGIANGAAIPGYSVAGKTGTAEIAGPVTVPLLAPDGSNTGETTTVYRYIEGWVDSSFIGIVPAESPRFVTLILVHRPALSGFYQMAEQPEDLFRRLAPRILDYLAIPPDRPLDAVASE